MTGPEYEPKYRQWAVNCYHRLPEDTHWTYRKWLDENCVRPTYIIGCKVWFDDPTDAMLFYTRFYETAHL